jgi:hypothetical protein
MEIAEPGNCDFEHLLNSWFDQEVPDLSEREFLIGHGARSDEVVGIRNEVDIGKSAGFASRWQWIDAGAAA